MKNQKGIQSKPQQTRQKNDNLLKSKKKKDTNKKTHKQKSVQYLKFSKMPQDQISNRVHDQNQTKQKIRNILSNSRRKIKQNLELKNKVDKYAYQGEALKDKLMQTQKQRDNYWQQLKKLKREYQNRKKQQRRSLKHLFEFDQKNSVGTTYNAYSKKKKTDVKQGKEQEKQIKKVKQIKKQNESLKQQIFQSNIKIKKITLQLQGINQINNQIKQRQKQLLQKTQNLKEQYEKELQNQKKMYKNQIEIKIKENRQKLFTNGQQIKNRYQFKIKEKQKAYTQILNLNTILKNENEKLNRQLLHIKENYEKQSQNFQKNNKQLVDLQQKQRVKEKQFQQQKQNLKKAKEYEEKYKTIKFQKQIYIRQLKEKFNEQKASILAKLQNETSEKKNCDLKLKQTKRDLVKINKQKQKFQQQKIKISKDYQMVIKSNQIFEQKTRLEIKSYQQEIEKLQKEVDIKAFQLQKISTAFRMRQEDYKKQENDIKKYKQKMQQKQKKNKGLNDQLEILRQNNYKYENLLKISKEEIQKLESKNFALRKQIDSMKKKLQQNSNNNEIQRIKKEMKRKDEEIIQLKNKLQKGVENKKKSEIQNEEIKNALNKELLLAKQKIEQLQTELEYKPEDNDDQFVNSKRMQNAQEIIIKQKNILINDLEVNVQKLTHELQDKNDRIETLMRKLQSQKFSHNIEMDVVNKEKIQFSQKLEFLQNKLLNSQKQEQTLKLKIDQYTNQLQQKSKSIVQNQKTISNITNQLHKCQSYLAQCTSNYEALRITHSNCQEDLRQKTTEINALNKELLLAKQKIEQLQTELEYKPEDNDDQFVNSKRMQNAQEIIIKQKNILINDLEVNVQKLTHELQDKNDRIETLMRKLQSQKFSHNIEMDVVNKEKIQFSQKLEFLQNKLLNSQKQEQTLKLKIDQYTNQLQQKSKSIVQNQKTISNITNQLHKCQSYLAQCTSNYEALRITHSNCQEDLRQKTTEINALNKELLLAKQKIEQLQTELEYKPEDNDQNLLLQKCNQIYDLKLLISSYETQITILKQQIQTKQIQNSNIQQTFTHYQQQLNSFKSSIYDLKKQSEQLKTKLQYQGRKYRFLQRQKNQISQRFIAKDLQIIQLRTNFENALTNLEYLQSQQSSQNQVLIRLKQKQQEIAEYKISLQKLEIQNEELKLFISSSQKQQKQQKPLNEQHNLDDDYCNKQQIIKLYELTEQIVFAFELNFKQIESMLSNKINDQQKMKEILNEFDISFSLLKKLQNEFLQVLNIQNQQDDQQTDKQIPVNQLTQNQINQLTQNQVNQQNSQFLDPEDYTNRNILIHNEHFLSNYFKDHDQITQQLLYELIQHFVEEIYNQQIANGQDDNQDFDGY